MTQIAAGKTPAAMCPYLNPGCKITAINGQAVKGLTFQQVKTRLQRAKTSVVLAIEEPLSLLHEENVSNRDSCYTWPVEAENGYLRKSLSEAQIRYVNSFQADELQTIDLTRQHQEQGRSPNDNDTKPKPVSVHGPSSSPSYQDMGCINEASSNPGSGSKEESSTPLPIHPELHEIPTATCQQEEQGTSPNANDAKRAPMSVYTWPPIVPSPPVQDKGSMDGASRNPGCHGIQESGPSQLLPLKSHEQPTDQDMPLCQNCLSITTCDKREQTIEHIPGKIYHWICLKLDVITPFFNDYRILGEKLGFVRPDIALLCNSNQPTNHLLNEWVARKGKGATVGVLMDVFDKTERHDLLDLLKTWTENCKKCFEYQQENVKETYI